MGVFAASDIVEVAIRIEENGINFYKFAEQIAKKEEAKKLLKASLRRWRNTIHRRVTRENTAPI